VATQLQLIKYIISYHIISQTEVVNILPQHLRSHAQVLHTAQFSSSTPQLYPSISSHQALCYFSPNSPTFVYLVLSYVTISLKVFLLIFPGPCEDVKISFLQRFTSSDHNRCLSHLALLAATAFNMSGSLQNGCISPLYLVRHTPLSFIGPDIFPQSLKLSAMLFKFPQICYSNLLFMSVNHKPLCYINCLLTRNTVLSCLLLNQPS
jgi:hypothetical protein